MKTNVPQCSLAQFLGAIFGMIVYFYIFYLLLGLAGTNYFVVGILSLISVFVLLGQVIIGIGTVYDAGSTASTSFERFMWGVTVFSFSAFVFVVKVVFFDFNPKI